MIKSQHGVSPLSLALSQNSIFFVQLIVDKLLTMRKDNRFIGLFFKNHLNALNLLGISNIAKVYNSLMVKV